MNKFERVLSSDDVFDLHEKYDGCVFKVIESAEQAVLAKLAGQEPVAIVDYFDGMVGLKKQINTLPKGMRLYARPMPSKPYSIDRDDAGIRKLVSEAITGAIHGGLEGGEAPPVGHWLNEFYEYGAAYENMQNRVHKNEVVCMSQPTDKKACVSENAESDTQHHLEYIKRYQKWRRGEDKTMSEMGLTPKQIGEALDWLIGVAENHIADMRKKVGSNHIPNAGKMVIPDGWQLTPTQATNDMYLGFCHVRNDIEPDEFREAYRAMLEAAPKPTP